MFVILLCMCSMCVDVQCVDVQCVDVQCVDVHCVGVFRATESQTVNQCWPMEYVVR